MGSKAQHEEQKQNTQHHVCLVSENVTELHGHGPGPVQHPLPGFFHTVTGKGFCHNHRAPWLCPLPNPQKPHSPKTSCGLWVDWSLSLGWRASPPATDPSSHLCLSWWARLSLSLGSSCGDSMQAPGTRPAPCRQQVHHHPHTDCSGWTRPSPMSVPLEPYGRLTQTWAQECPGPCLHPCSCPPLGNPNPNPNPNPDSHPDHLPTPTSRQATTNSHRSRPRTSVWACTTTVTSRANKT